MRLWTPPDGVGARLGRACPPASWGKVDIYIQAESALKPTKGAPAEWITLPVHPSGLPRQKRRHQTTVTHSKFSRKWRSLKVCSEQTTTARRRRVWHERKEHQSDREDGGVFEGAKSTAHQPNRINANAHTVGKKMKNEGTFAPADDSTPSRRFPGDMTARGWLFTRWKAVTFDFPQYVKPQSIHLKTSLLSRDTIHHLSTFMKMWCRHFWWI